MINYSIKPMHIAISDLPLESAHGGQGSRRMILSSGTHVSPNLEAFTNGFLPANGKFDWHKHDDVDEMMVCLSGGGTIEFESGEKFDFGVKDLVYIPKGIAHTISSPIAPSEYFFIRLK